MRDKDKELMLKVFKDTILFGQYLLSDTDFNWIQSLMKAYKLSGDKFVLLLHEYNRLKAIAKAFE